MGRKVFHFAKLRSKIETNKREYGKVAIFFLRVKIGSVRRKIQTRKKFFPAQRKEGKQYFCLNHKRERKYLPKSFPSSSSFLSIFSITPLGVFSFVCSFVCLLNARTRARKRAQYLHLQELACLLTAQKDTRREKTDKKHVQYLHLQELATLLTARKGTKREKNHKKYVQYLHLQELATILTALKGTKREKNNKKHVQVLHLQDIPQVFEAHFRCF